MTLKASAFYPCSSTSRSSQMLLETFVLAALTAGHGHDTIVKRHSG